MDSAPLNSPYYTIGVLWLTAVLVILLHGQQRVEWHPVHIAQHKERKELYAKRGPKLMDVLPGSKHASSELMGTAIQFLCSHYPAQFQFDPRTAMFHNAVLGRSYTVRTTDPWHFLLKNLPEGLLITQADPTTGLYRLTAMGRDVAAKIGKPSFKKQYRSDKTSDSPTCTDHPCTPIANHRSPTEFPSPIQLVPTEVLIEILSHLGPGRLDDNVQVILHECARAAIIPPTHVCQRWRQIALSTPSLWNRITVHLTGSDSRKKVECVTSWLERGGHYPLFVKLLCRGQGDEYQRGWDDLVETVIGHSCRWQEAAFSASLLSTCFSGVRNRLPLLQTLRLELGSVYPPNAFEAAPMLSAVVDLNSNSLRNLRRLPWTQLTDVTAHRSSFTHALSILKMLPHIVRFTADLKSNTPISMTPPVRLSELRNLALSYGGIGLDCFLDCLESPSLVKLTLSERPGAHTTWSTSLISLIHRSSCYDIATLDFTFLQCGVSEPPSMDELIRVTPKLKTLDIHNDIHALVAYRESRDYSRFVKALTATCGTGLYPAPELQTLLLDYWKGFRVRLFVDMVESRWRVDSSGGSVKRINSVRLRRVPDAAIFNAVAMERLREFAAEGLTIEVEVVTRDYVSNGEYEHQLIVFEEGLSPVN